MSSTWVARSIYIFSRFKRLRQIVDQCDAIIIGGGGLLQGGDPRFLLSMRAISRLATARRRPLYLVAVGAEGAWSLAEAGLYRNLAKLATGVFPRDNRTLDRLGLAESVSCWRVADFALQMPAAISRGGLGVNVRHFDSEDRRTAHRQDILEFCSTVSSDTELTLFTTGNPEDGAALNHPDLAGITANRWEPNTVPELLDGLARFAAVRPSRLHSAILAIGSGCRLIEPDPGNLKLAEWLRGYADTARSIDGHIEIDQSRVLRDIEALDRALHFIRETYAAS
ncbi:polysaccharide pyruvyl transferase family protein [Microbacterium enclense]|uniref:polysaccharide pyruvyl transferase family protein n=1 Tax=Microbacterium enclense TaxID=993073 RepID=UPI0036DB5CD0